VFTINCVNREIFEDKQFLSGSDRDYSDIQNVHSPTNSEQIDIDALSNFNESEYLDSISDCEGERDSIKTQKYLEDFSYHNKLSSRALE
jgi:hypothetical protein